MITPGSWQSKTLLLLTNMDKKLSETESMIVICH